MADIPWWTKLWWHGVDIAAGVIVTLLSTAIVSLTGFLLFRRAISIVEKDKELARIAAQDEAEATRSADSSRLQRASLNSKREDFAMRAESITNSGELVKVVLALNQWLFSQGLHHVEPNKTLIQKWESLEWQRLLVEPGFVARFVAEVRSLKVEGDT